MDNQTLINEYKSRINKACDHIEKNLTNSFSLEQLAEVASFSKFHFHRIFMGLTGETPFQFIQRIRLERAASYLATNKTETISDIAFRVGFTDLSVFSRNFKSYFGVSPTQFRKEEIEKSNLSQIKSNYHQANDQPQPYFCFDSQTLKWKTNMKLNESVEVRELPKMTVAYLRHVGPYNGDEHLFENLWKRLFTWAGPRGLVGGDDFNSLIIYHDDPSVTNEEKLRISVCITVEPETKVDGEIGKMEVEGGKYVVARFKVSAEEFEEAWGWVYGEWLPSSGYQPDDKPCFEMYPDEPKDGKFTVDICVPVRPM